MSTAEKQEKIRSLYNLDIFTAKKRKAEAFLLCLPKNYST